MRSFIEKEKISFDPEAIEIMVHAFSECWKAVQQSGAAVNDESARDILARYIVDAALNGERDPQRLSQFAVLHLAQATGVPFEVLPPRPLASKPIETNE
jgi:hypothetical protein